MGFGDSSVSFFKSLLTQFFVYFFLICQFSKGREGRCGVRWALAGKDIGGVGGKEI